MQLADKVNESRIELIEFSNKKQIRMATSEQTELSNDNQTKALHNESFEILKIMAKARKSSNE